MDLDQVRKLDIELKITKGINICHFTNKFKNYKIITQHKIFALNCTTLQAKIELSKIIEFINNWGNEYILHILNNDSYVYIYKMLKYDLTLEGCIFNNFYHKYEENTFPINTYKKISAILTKTISHNLIKERDKVISSIHPEYRLDIIECTMFDIEINLLNNLNKKFIYNNRIENRYKNKHVTELQNMYNEDIINYIRYYIYNNMVQEMENLIRSNPKFLTKTGEFKDIFELKGIVDYINKFNNHIEITNLFKKYGII